MLGAILDHENFAVALDDGGLDLADLLVEQDLVRQFAVHDLLANLRDAAWAERIGLARPAEWRLLLLVAFQQRLVGPGRGEGRVLVDLVEFVKHNPGGTGRHGHCFFDVLDWLVHSAIRDSEYKPAPLRRLHDWVEQANLPSRWGYLSSNGTVEKPPSH